MSKVNLSQRIDKASGGQCSLDESLVPRRWIKMESQDYIKKQRYEKILRNPRNEDNLQKFSWGLICWQKGFFWLTGVRKMQTKYAQTTRLNIFLRFRLFVGFLKMYWMISEINQGCYHFPGRYAVGFNHKRSLLSKIDCVQEIKFFG